EVIDLCFEGTPSPIGGLGFEEIATDVLARHAAAYGSEAPKLANPGYVKFHKGGEYHATNPVAVRALHELVDPGLQRLKSTAAADGGELELETDAEEAEAVAASDTQQHAAHLLHASITGDPDYHRYLRFAEAVN